MFFPPDMMHGRYQTVEKLQQSYIFIPSKYKVCVWLQLMKTHDQHVSLRPKDCYLVAILNELAGNSFMVFCGTCNNTQRWVLSQTLCPQAVQCVSLFSPQGDPAAEEPWFWCYPTARQDESG